MPPDFSPMRLPGNVQGSLVKTDFERETGRKSHESERKTIGDAIEIKGFTSLGILTIKHKQRPFTVSPVFYGLRDPYDQTHGSAGKYGVSLSVSTSSQVS